MDDEIRLSRAYLSRVAEPPAPALTTLIDLVGPVEAAAMVRRGNVSDAVEAETRVRRDHDQAAVDLAKVGQAGGRLLCPEDADWPSDHMAALGYAYLHGLSWAAPPVALWVRGDRWVSDTLDNAVAVIGARAATSYGEHVASDFACIIAGAGTAIVSGGAFGIDAAAHRGALVQDGNTVAVLGCGIDVAYPNAHSAMLGNIADRGLLISEYPPATLPARHRFPTRNRLTAAFAAATVVIEAGVRSGSKHTAAAARVLGRPVLAVPGPITSSMSAGCHALLRSHRAELVTSAADVLQVVEQLAEPPGRTTSDGGGDALRVFVALAPQSEMTVSQLADACGLPQRQVSAALIDLESTRSVVCGDIGWLRA